MHADDAYEGCIRTAQAENTDGKLDIAKHGRKLPGRRTTFAIFKHVIRCHHVTITWRNLLGRCCGKSFWLRTFCTIFSTIFLRIFCTIFDMGENSKFRGIFQRTSSTDFCDGFLQQISSTDFFNGLLQRIASTDFCDIDV